MIKNKLHIRHYTSFIISLLNYQSYLSSILPFLVVTRYMLQFLTAVEDEIQGALDSFIKNIFFTNFISHTNHFRISKKKYNIFL